ncbi:uridine kinase family protein [Streptomyces sp.]|uniref:uridine kinase family protein n=1 Tax=Streptomyces sp. TaxID=1931 RepID=UPI002F421707
MTGVASWRTAPVLAVAGGTASGKSTLAEALARHHPETVGLIHLDDFYDRLRGVRTMSAIGVEILDWNHPASMDEAAVAEAVDEMTASGQYRLVVVEGLFALALPAVTERATWRVYVDTPDDIRLARKILRKIEILGQDPGLALRNYLLSGRERHAAHVAPSRSLADLVVDGTEDEFVMIAAVLKLVGPVLAEPVRAEPALDASDFRETA